MYGKRYVWIIIGWYDDSWWERDLETEGVSCDVREMRMAVDGWYTNVNAHVKSLSVKMLLLAANVFI